MTESTDESLAKALGWTQCNTIKKSSGLPCFRWLLPNGLHAQGEPPRYTESFDACLRDIVPVLRARGITFSIDDLGAGYGMRMAFHNQWITSIDESLPAAFCEAALKALEATNG